MVINMTEYGKYRFNIDWKFRKDIQGTLFQKVNLPHDYSINNGYSLENVSGKKGGFVKTGKLIYQKVIKVDTSKRNFLEFDGIYKDAEVFVNGNKVIHFPYGYLGFRVEITDFLTAQENIITVTVDDSQGTSSRWYNGLGIYRNVWLIEKNKNIIQTDSYVYAEEIEKNRAKLHIEFSTDGGSYTKISLLEEAQKEVISLILEKKNQTSKNRNQASKNMHKTDIKESVILEVPNPLLWSVENPYLYQVKLELFDENNEILDFQIIDFGIRTTVFSSHKGFFLNGKSMKIRGACLHHDIGGLGAAVSLRQQKERILKLKTAGFNAIRTGHTPFEPEFYDLCNHLGMLVMDEMFDGWYQKAVNDYAGNYFDIRGIDDLILFLKRDRNHPCVVIWGMGNETGNTDVHHLTEICHQYDKTRPVSGGQLLNGVDIIGLNGPSEAPGYIEKLYYERPNDPVLLAEFPHCYQTRGFYRTKTWWRDYGRPRFDIADYTENEIFDDYSPKFGKVVCYNSSYDNASCRISHKDCIRRMEDLEHVLGMFMWTGYDYMGESFGWPFRFGNYGIVDLCGFEKDAYYLYQSAWTKTPMVHLLPHWNHTGKEGVLIPVVAYTNCDSVELFLNGKSYGKQQKKNKMELLWHIPYMAGTLDAVGYIDQQESCRDSKVTEGMTTKFDILPTESLLMDSQDVIGITIQATDEQGNFANYANDIVYFDVAGGGELCSLENGDPFDLQNNCEDHRRFFYGLQRAYVKSNGKEEATILRACSIMSKRYFVESTQVSIFALAYQLGQEKTSSFAKEIKYTVDGSCPLTYGKKYQESFIITETTTVKAVIITSEQNILLESTFIKGQEKEMDTEFNRPLCKELVGSWIAESSELVFFENGNVDVYEGGNKLHEVSWWYELPIDEFESETGDIDCGEIQFPFHNLKLKLLKDGNLRQKHMTPEGEIIKIFKRDIAVL